MHTANWSSEYNFHKWLVFSANCFAPVSTFNGAIFFSLYKFNDARIYIYLRAQRKLIAQYQFIKKLHIFSLKHDSGTSSGMLHYAHLNACTKSDALVQKCTIPKKSGHKPLHYNSN